MTEVLIGLSNSPPSQPQKYTYSTQKWNATMSEFRKKILHFRENMKVGGNTF